jgi:hypothetical protein
MAAPAHLAPGDLLTPGPSREAQDDGDSRWYVHPESGEQYLSVTFVTGRTNGKPWLAPHYAKAAAEYAVDFIDEWQRAARQARAEAIVKRQNPDQAARDAAVALIKRQAARQRDLKADLGSWWHDVQEALVLDTPLPGIPEDLDGRVVDWAGETVLIDQAWLDQVFDGWLAFVQDFPDMEILAAECTVASDEHEAAGTIDLIVRMPDGRVLVIDLKTGAHLGREILAQLGPYHRFGTVWLRDGRIVAKPATDGAAVLHLRPEYSRGYKLIEASPAELDAGWEWWRACRVQLHISEQVPARFGHVYYPPLPDGSQPPPMVEDLRSYPGCSRVVRPLVDAGFVWLADLALVTAADVLALRGVGEKTVAALTAVLVEHGLTFATTTEVA